MVPIGIFSKRFTATQQRYSTFDRELLAAYLASLHFRTLITGRNVTIFTDHKPLVDTFKSSREMKSDRNQRYLGIITEYVTDMKYIRGADNVVADALSRLSNNNENTLEHTIGINTILADYPTDLPAISDAQSQAKMSCTDTNLKSYDLGNGKSIICEISTPYPRPVIPALLQKHVMDHFHKLGHFGFRKSANIISTRYYWQGMRKDIKQFCKTCWECQSTKIGRHTKSTINTFALPSNRFETVHVDIVGPLPPPENRPEHPYQPPARYLLTMIDRNTSWVEAAPLISTTAEEVAQTFIATWVSRFGVPLYILTDRGSQFESEFFRLVATSIGFHRLRTTAYHPQANGKLERQHRTLKAIIKARKGSWLENLPLALLAMHIALDENGITPFTKVTGEHPMVPRILITQGSDPCTVKKTIDAMLETAQPRRHKTATYIPKDLNDCSHVWVRVDRIRKALEAPYQGPFPVIERQQKYFKILLLYGASQTVSID